VFAVKLGHCRDFSLPKHNAPTESVSLRADEKLTAFLEEPCAVVFNRAQKVTALEERAALA